MDDRQAQGASAPEQQQEAVAEVRSAPRKRVSSQYIATGVVMCISVATLMAMRRWGMSEGIKYEHANVAASAPAPLVDNAKFGKVMERLASSRTPLQVSAEHIVKDPFILGAGPVRETAPVDDSAERARQAAEAARLASERRERELMDAFGRLTLQTVMLGRVPVARINNQIVGVDEMVEGRFQVVLIDASGVTLEADGREFRLEVDGMVGGVGQPRGGRPSPTSTRPPVRRP